MAQLVRKMAPHQEIRASLDNHFISSSDSRRGSHIPSMPKYYFPTPAVQKYVGTPQNHRVGFLKRITGR